MALPWGFTLGGNGSLNWVDCENNRWPFHEPGQPRSDPVHALCIFAYNRAFTLAGFSPQIFGGQGGANLDRPAMQL